ncbi:MAG TPA: TPM domain-containing protein [Candidatus Eremiobacteraceae bacterium]|nr:TPM domain-containing protein [Candidatus Eremiobacteraceae bacterium]
MRVFGAVLALAAAASHVDDGAHMLSQTAIVRIDSIDDALAARTGKSVAVVTVRSHGGVLAIETVLREAHLRAPKGALVYIVQDGDQAILFDPQTAGLVPPALPGAVRRSLRSAIKSGDVDGGVIEAVSTIADVIEGGPSGGHGPAPAQVAAAQRRFDADGADVSWIWWILGFIVVIVLLRIVFARRGAA